MDRKTSVHIIQRCGKLFLTAGLAALILSGCKSSVTVQGKAEESSPALESAAEPAEVVAMSPFGPEFPSLELEGVQIPETPPVPPFLNVGVQHPIVMDLQGRLMELGFMDNDEPTDYFGNATEQAVKIFQRQNGLEQDGVVGAETLASIMSPDAKYYAVSKGVSGSDINQIQNRLYELGYLASADQITGDYGDETEAAVIKLQGVNSLDPDGKIGQQTLNLLYSDDIKPNMIAFGEQSEVVLASQTRLKELGYLTTTPDGTYGTDTSIAVKRFQSRNDLVVDGYLGPTTRLTLHNSEARPNGLTLGEEGDSVERVQQLLNKYGYLDSSRVTGYYGEVTENAVKSFQTQNGLNADGSVGVMTMAKLTGSDVKSAPRNTTPTTRRSSGGGSSGGSSGSGSKNSGSGGSTVHLPGGAGSLIAVARSKVGSPYVWGAKGPNSFDCSGFIYWCLKQVGVSQSYLTSSGWRNPGRYTKISRFGDLQAGDIVVVSGHVGICAGGGVVIDASSSHGRVVERSLSSWWQSNFIVGWRIFG